MRAAAKVVETGPARRLVLDGSASGRLGLGVFTLGRALDCDVVLPEATVSRHHAELRCEDGAWTLTDLRSRNGTYVNGRRAWRVRVEPGDELVLGGERLRFQPATVEALETARTATRA